jgi:hypothetical protein
MSHTWILESEPGANAGPGKVSLGVQNADGKALVTLIPACQSLEEFEHSLSTLKDELDGLRERAAQAFKAMEPEEEPAALSPDELWATMKGCTTEQEMFDYFNSQDRALRQETAEFILTQVSMFSGRGPVFAAHYDQDGKVLV